jgi:glycosyltransferase involved in cell wall biosynthesis
MKVLMVTPTYYPIVGGREAVVYRLTAALNRNGVPTDIMTFNMDSSQVCKWRGETEFSEGFRIYKIPGLDWFPLHLERITMGVNLIPGRFLNLTKDYDILHFHGPELSFPTFSYFSRKPKILHLHGLDTRLFQRYALNSFLLKHVADLYISLTEQMKKGLIELGIPDDKIRCLLNGIDVGLFHPSKEKEGNMILFVGRISPDKGLHVLLDSLDYLKQSVQVVVIGPRGWNLKYFNDILCKIEKENKKGKHKIKYLGTKSQKYIVEWYQKASIFVLATLDYEALGIVNLEALACETPVIATNLGGVSEAVRDGENGILIEPNKAVKLANAIQYLLDNENIRKKFGKNGRKWITENFANEIITEKLLRIYRELI